MSQFNLSHYHWLANHNIYLFIFVIFCFSGDTTESELCRVFSAYGNVKSTKIIVDRAGVSKGYGFVTFETELEAQRLQNDVSLFSKKKYKSQIHLIIFHFKEKKNLIASIYFF